MRYVAASDRQIGDDPTFDRRADAIAAHVRDVQARADAAAGRWARGGGPADRRILDVLCALALHALSGSLEADTRRLALLAGVGRETARTALLRLSEDGWIAQTAAADGPRAAHWTIDPQSALHSNSDHARSQADPRPLGPGLLREPRPSQRSAHEQRMPHTTCSPLPALRSGTWPGTSTHESTPQLAPSTNCAP